MAARYGLDGTGIESRWRKTFRTRQNPPSLLYNAYRVSLQGITRPGSGVTYQHASSGESRAVPQTLPIMVCFRVNLILLASTMNTKPALSPTRSKFTPSPADENTQHGRQCMYKVTLRSVRVTTDALKTQHCFVC
jgi:hypothetical protein